MMLVPISACFANSANGTSPLGEGCALSTTAVRAVTQIVDVRSVRLDDGSELFLKGLVTPSPHDAGVVRGNWPPAKRTLELLESLLHGRSVEIAAADRKPDRYGRTPAQALTRVAGQRLWVQAELVRRGAARVDVAGLSPSCARVLLELERAAERANSGIWSHAAYGVRKADRPRALLRYRSTFQIVEGTVYKVARVRKRIFINFAANWRRDFTIGLSARMSRSVVANGIDLDGLAGKRVRVRGWIARRGGPFIFLRSALQLELRPAKEDEKDRRPPTGREPALHGAARDISPETKNRPAAVPPGDIDL